MNNRIKVALAALAVGLCLTPARAGDLASDVIKQLKSAEASVPSARGALKKARRASGSRAKKPRRAAPQARGSGGVSAEEVGKLAEFLKGRTLSCKKDKTETLSVSVSEQNGKKTLRAASAYGDGGQDGTEVAQLSVGGLLMIHVTGPDPDEGGAVALVPSEFVEGRVAAVAVVYQETGPEDGSGAIESLECRLKQ